jgi:hypothetical protein
MALQATAQSPLYGESSTFLVGHGERGTVMDERVRAGTRRRSASVVSIFGAANSAIGSFYAAQNQQNQLRMQAQNQAFAAQMGRINQRGAEFTAAMMGEQGSGRSAHTPCERVRRASARRHGRTRNPARVGSGAGGRGEHGRHEGD